jgi:hypothetical protein
MAKHRNKEFSRKGGTELRAKGKGTGKKMPSTPTEGGDGKFHAS